MTTGATTLLSLALPVEGELDGTWGDVVNYGITDYVDIAVAGTLTFTGDGAITLANTVGTSTGTNISSTTAQYAIIKVTGTLTTTKVITAPSYSKTYIVDNAATGGVVTFKASGQTGVSVAVGEKCTVYYNGTDYVKVASSVVDGVSTISFGSTGLTPSTATSGAVTVAGTLAVLNGGTGVTTSTGTGNVVLSTSPTLVTPILGTPQSVTLTNATGLPISTGVSGLGTNVATFLATPSSANLAAALTDETGSGSAVFATSPTLVTPILGTPQSATLTNATGLPISTGVSGLGSNVATFLATPSSANLAAALTDETGSGANVFATSPTLVTPILGTPQSATLTNATGLPISTGVSGLGTGVATALAVNVGSAGAPVVNGGVLGTPSSGTATNITGLPLTTGVTGTLPVANGGTGVTSSTGTGSVVLSASPALTGTPTVPTATAGTNTTQAASTAFVINQIGAIAAGVSSFSAGTTGLTPSLATSGAVTLAGTLAIANGGTGTTSTTFVNLASNVTGTLPVANGGTGVTTSTGSGNNVLSTSPTLVTPILGTPTSATLTNATGLPLTTGVTGTLPVANGGTGVTTSTGSGNVVLSTSPTLVTPILGTPQSATLTNATGLPISTGVSGLGTGVATALAVNVGSAGAPVVNGGVLGTPSSGTLTNATGLPLSTGVTGTLAVANGGTGTATPSLVQGTGVTITGSWPNQTIAASSTAGQYQAVASGTLANGSMVVVNADGTVSVVNSNNQSAGTAATFVTSTSVSDVCATYDVTNNKVVVAYVEGTAPNPIYAVVGTVSGTSISFGTPVLVVNNSAYPTITYDTAQSKVVIAYANTSTNVGAVVVGTVSGTSISFGTAVSFVTGSYPTFINAAYEATQSRVVIAYTDQANSAYGTAIVGSVSGTTISFGTSVVIVAANVLTYFSVTAVGSSKVVISYRNNSSSSVGTAVVGTATSTSISFGTPVVFNNAATIYIVSAYDTTNSKVVVAYSDTGNSDYGTAIVGTVSGTSISFGSEIVFESAFVSNLGIAYSSFANRIVISWRITGTGYATTITGLVSGTTISFGSSTAANAVSSFFPTVVYDSTSQKVVLAYRNSTASSGQSQVLTVGTNNLTATNYIGISSAAYANGATAIIQTVGSTDDAQTSLTPGLAYYVQTDGTLASTAGSPSVFAGTAVAATKILVKG